ncbi:phosphate ABC transporter permease subunit PstC [Dinghuibacter silviterrae]|uniref:Phosphate transport system permease protein n=1 Tax=Dinghuibacter silviterrae TaxID=1539049 RepID=A0A4V3GLN8_9BACT|nr:phosphate ABC transporter permease subunit PstC [Dinghuibacter silviterrae]TDX00263.1 phosphate transport system permease protein [Dinghuibacter silviterrae]
MRTWKDRLIGNLFGLLTLATVLIVVLIGAGLWWKSVPILRDQSIGHLLFSTEWKPFSGHFGFLSYIVGSILVTAIAVGIALPVSLLAAIYLSEFADARFKNIVTPLIDLLSGIPPIIYGVWGVLTLVPATGYSALTGGIVLAVMIFPLLISILLDVFRTVPQGLRDASLSLGANDWETARKVLLKRSAPGILAATILAVSRALGETIAVLMVCGNVAALPHSVFDPVYPLPALIANNYGDMMSIPLYDSALMLSALVLFGLIFVFNALSRVVLHRLERRQF